MPKEQDSEERQRARDRFDALAAPIVEAYRDIPEDEGMREIDSIIEQIRAERSSTKPSS